MAFAVVCGRKNLPHFQEKEGFLGGIFMVKQDEDFPLDLHKLPREVEKIYVEDRIYYWDFVLPYLDDLAKTKEIIFFKINNTSIEEIKWKKDSNHPKLKFHFPQNNRTLDEEEIAISRQCCKYIKKLLKDTDSQFGKECISEALPQTNWEQENPYMKHWKTIVGEDPRIFNNLRLFTQAFSGYSLWQMRPAQGSGWLTSLPEGMEETLQKLDGKPDAWALEYLKVASKVAPDLCLALPGIFGEMGWEFEGKILNHDSYVYWERILLLHECGVIQRLQEKDNPVIVEIGGGFGGLAYMIKKLVPEARYFIIDLPESLIFSAIYLSVLFKNDKNFLLGPDDSISDQHIPGFTFLPHFLFHRLVKELDVDLCINTLSLSEMAEFQVREYCEGIKKLIGSVGVFFEQNHDNRHLGLVNAEDIVGEYFAVKETLGSKILNTIVNGQANLWKAS